MIQNCFGEKIANDGEMAEKEVEEALWEVYGIAKGDKIYQKYCNVEPG